MYYLNGFRIGALRVTDNPARYTSDATLQPDEGQAEVLSLPATHLREGDNVLAVEVHQSGSSSSDVMFAMALGALESITNTTSGSAPVVVLNEVFARNQTRALPDGNLAGWVELYNPGTNDVVLTGLALSDDAATPRKWEFPDGPVLPPKGFRTIRFDATQPASGTNTGFGLSARGGSVFLSDRSSAGGAVLDALHYGLQAADFGVGRVPDGGGDWELTVPAPNGKLDYRCASEPDHMFTRKGGTPEEIGGRVCLCNALVASAGLPQLRKDGTEEQPIVTLGDDLDGARVLLAREPGGYDATTAVQWLHGEL